MEPISTAVKGIGYIISTIKAIKAVHDLSANDAGKAITLGEFQHVIRAENAKFFMTITVSELEGIREYFYTTTLPSVISYGDITSADIQPHGALGPLFSRLWEHIDIVKRRLDSLVGVFRAHDRDLHIDDLVYGQFILIRLYGLLLHMHSTYATLRRIQIGAESLDDSRLSYDTRAVIHYIDSIETALRWMNWYTWERRRDDIGPLKEKYTQPPSVMVPGHHYWEFTDRYSSVPSTLPEHRLTVLPSKQSNSKERQANAQRNDHVMAVKNKYETAASCHVQQFREDLGSLRVDMLIRLQSQESGCPAHMITNVDSLPTDRQSRVKVEGQGEPTVEEFAALEISADMNEYLPLSAAA